MSERKSGGSVCAVRGCKNKSYTCKKSFFKFPKQENRARMWILRSNREDLLTKDKLSSYRLCEDHFEEKMFTNYCRNRLNANAFPTLFPCLEDRSSFANLDHTYHQPPLANVKTEVDFDDTLEAESSANGNHTNHQPPLAPVKIDVVLDDTFTGIPTSIITTASISETESSASGKHTYHEPPLAPVKIQVVLDDTFTGIPASIITTASISEDESSAISNHTYHQPILAPVKTEVDLDDTLEAESSANGYHTYHQPPLSPVKIEVDLDDTITETPASISTASISETESTISETESNASGNYTYHHPPLSPVKTEVDIDDTPEAESSASGNHTYHEPPLVPVKTEVDLDDTLTEPPGFITTASISEAESRESGDHTYHQLAPTRTDVFDDPLIGTPGCITTASISDSESYVENVQDLLEVCMDSPTNDVPQPLSPTPSTQTSVGSTTNSPKRIKYTDTIRKLTAENLYLRARIEALEAEVKNAEENISLETYQTLTFKFCKNENTANLINILLSQEQKQLKARRSSKQNKNELKKK